MPGVDDLKAEIEELRADFGALWLDHMALRESLKERDGSLAKSLRKARFRLRDQILRDMPPAEDGRE